MRNQKGFFAGIFFGLALLSAGAGAIAQEAPEKSSPRQGDVIVGDRLIVAPQGQGIRMPAPPGDDTILFLSTEMNLNGKVVKGAPYSAQAVTETTRTLSDGNRIRHKTSATLYRDSEGRTRREQELGAIGPWAISGEPRQTIFINDPVSGVNYILDPSTRTARKMAPLRLSFGSGDGGAAGSAQAKVRIEREVIAAQGGGQRVEGPAMQEFNIQLGAGPELRVREGGSQKAETESLGKQSIEGVLAEGTRTTMTIPAGQVGNEQPIQIVFEKWYSPELQTVIMTRHSDPFVGETVYKLTNIVRGEQARNLFEVPGDYTIKEAAAGTRVMRRSRQEDEK